MFDYIYTYEFIMSFMIIFTRVGLLLFFFPIFGDEYNPRVVKIVLGISLTLFLIPIVDLSNVAQPTDLVQFGGLIIPEVFFTLAVGLSARLIMEIFSSAGEFVGLQMGFLTASQVNPANQSQISLVGQFWHIGAILIFFGINGHHIFIRAIAYSFDVVPPFQAVINKGLVDLINQFIIEMLYIATQLSAPIVVAMVLVNVCLALANKVVPNMHVFMESFPIRILLGLGMLMALSGATFILFERIFEKVGHHILAVMSWAQ